MFLMENRDLLDRYRSGEREALSLVFLHYSPSVLKWVSTGFYYRTKDTRARFSGLRSPSDQHDVVSEVFRKIFERGARLGYSGLKPFEGYLFAVARNTILRRVGVKSPKTVSDDRIIDSIPTEERSPEDNVARAQEHALVRRFLEQLGAEDRRFVELRFMEDRSQAKVAETLSWTRKKVRIREEKLRTTMTRYFKRARTTGELEEALVHAAR